MAAAEAAEASKPRQPPRFMLLSTPKPPPIGFIPDRFSVYWDNGLTPKDYSKPTKFVVSKRQEELAQSKRMHRDYVPQRFTPIWVPSPFALHAQITPRVEFLANPKRCHPDYRPAKLVNPPVSGAALLFHPTPRLCQLARPKDRIANPNVKEDADWQTWDPDSLGRLRIPTASQRVQVLADPKQVHQLYMPPKNVQWEVSKEALSSVASERVVKLARPKSKHLDTEDYRANAWAVPPAALLAQASPRINELATPLPRKVRAKKQPVTVT